MPSLAELLLQTWPAKAAGGLLAGFKAPGDAYAGRLDPLSDEGIERAVNLAGMVMGGTAFTAPRGALGAGPGIRAYHGSPHDFERFSASKIGTGEGAQSFGHGLYFAENPAVAETYRKSTRALSPEGEKVYGARLREADKVYEEAVAKLHEAQRGGRAAPESLREDVISAGYKRDQLWVDAHDKYPGKGHMYEVNINSDPERFLPWGDLPENARNIVPGAGSGEDVWRYFSKEAGPDNAALILKDAGFPGIRYPDQGSRGMTGGTNNYVVFDPATIDVLRKYGIIGAALGGGAAGVMKNENGVY